MNKKICITIGCVITTLSFALICTIFVIRLYWNNSINNYKHSNTYTSGCYTITVKQTDAQWSFGSSNVKIIAENTDTKDKKEFFGGISDDGALGKIDVEFCENNANGYDAIVTLSGSEMETKNICIEMDDKIYFDVTLGG